jgi:hypothetical protein
MKRKLMTIVAATCLTGVFGQTAQAAPLTKNVDPAPQVERQGGAFPDVVCRPGYFQQGSRLCMTDIRGPLQFPNAEIDCQDIKGRVSEHNDWRYRRFRGDGISAPVGFWLGHHTADNTALFVNLPNDGDFDGETSVFEFRFYTCSHDDTL